MITKARVIKVPVTITSGASVDISDLDHKCVYLSGTFVATVQFQISADGANWFNEGSALTASGPLEITKPARYLRANTTAFTSGAPIAQVVGIYSSDAGGMPVSGS